MEILLNRRTAVLRKRAVAAAKAFGPHAAAAVEAMLRACPAHQETPLVDLPALAGALGVGAVWAKDERGRMGLASFKALGGALAVLELAQAEAARRTGRAAALQALIGAGWPSDPPVFAAATAGNHGRSVAAGAALVGAQAMIFVYDGAPEDQVAAIAGHGATIVRIPGTYDDALAACRAQADAEGWTVVSDTAADANEDAPQRVQRGYAVIGAEMARQAPQPPTHLFVQAGVGGLAAALCAHARQAWRPAPRVVVVEPRTAACLKESARAGAPVTIALDGRTAMGRLECRSPSLAAWPVLAGLAKAFVAIDEAEAAAAVGQLAAAGLATSPSGAAGFAALRAAAADPQARRVLGLAADSRVVVVISEAPTAADLAARPLPSLQEPQP
jgi:diaminopropionate ammonia-lyase